MEELFNQALDYVRQNWRNYVSEAEEAYALEFVDIHRSPITDFFEDAVRDIMDDFSSEHNIEDEDWWYDFTDEEELIWNAIS